ncbi:hypothetical protein H6F89_05125 [Cyanobacteria bacterium FACHB-63]|nr:hypothetical protein [Cyanobacteria bacterium FACHB-63]
MDQSLYKDVSKNMRRTGMLLFRDAFLEALQGERRMCVVHAAHAAEILLKARVAQEHFLLIFSRLPKSDPNKDALTLAALLENGRTFSYEELPDQLWATTGIRIERLNQYREFGRLRNQIIHFSTANAKELNLLTLRYSLEVLDPLVESFWGRSVIDFIENDPFIYLPAERLENLIRQSGCAIDERLRRILGENSREAWESMQAYFKELREHDESLPSEYWEAAEEAKQYEDPLADENYSAQLKAHENWKVLLDSF